MKAGNKAPQQTVQRHGQRPEAEPAARIARRGRKRPRPSLPVGNKGNAQTTTEKGGPVMARNYRIVVNGTAYEV